MRKLIEYTVEGEPFERLLPETPEEEAEFAKWLEDGTATWDPGFAEQRKSTEELKRKLAGEG
mgnify:CR=1 FL=1